MFEMRHRVDKFFPILKMFILFNSSKTLKSTNISIKYQMISYDSFFNLHLESSRHPIASLKFYRIYSQHHNQLNFSVQILGLNLTNCKI